MKSLDIFINTIYNNKKNDFDKWFWTISQFCFTLMCYIFSLLILLALLFNVRIQISKSFFMLFVGLFWLSLFIYFFNQSTLKFRIEKSEIKEQYSKMLMLVIENGAPFCIFISIILYAKLIGM